MSIFSLKPDPVVGIDISSTAVKLLEISRAKGGYRVESYAMEPLPERAVEDNNIMELEVVGEAVSRVIKRAKPKAQHAAVAVAGPSVITKIISMPDEMSDSDRMETIRMDIDQYISFPSEDVNLDFEVIGASEKEEGRADVLLVASRSETVDTRMAVIEIAGMKVRVVDIERFALENAFLLIAENDPDISPEESIALVEVGATKTTMSILTEGRIGYSREEMFGGNRLTEEISHRYGLSHEEANMAKRNGGLPDDYEADLLEPFKMEVAQQISRMVQFYYSSSTDKLSHILIAGGCASIPGIMEHISNKVGGHVSIANPLAGMAVSSSRIDRRMLQNDAPALMIACGLALRSFDEY